MSKNLDVFDRAVARYGGNALDILARRAVGKKPKKQRTEPKDTPMSDRDARLKAIRQRAYSSESHKDDLSPAWSTYANDVPFLLAELDAAKAREADFHMAYRQTCDVESKAALVRAEKAEQQVAILREKAKAVLTAFDAGRWIGADGLSRAVSDLAVALAEGEDTPPVCDCNGGEQGDGLCALPHEPTCASLKREDTRG